jgi:putative GTP pyrophosphokinase
MQASLGRNQVPVRKRTDSLTAAYAQREGTYRDFAACVRDLIAQIIASNEIKVHSVTCRAKSQASFAGKISKEGKTYGDLAEVTDLAGVRIITHFADDAETIAGLIEAEFDIDTENSVDKRRLLEPNEFGYLSIHHVACLPEKRSTLAEYSRFKGLKVEIQTRSILQHAWAEIEHDIGYKSATAVPRRLRRRISRLAGLLELADQEFQTVRDEIASYQRDLERLVIEKPHSVELDKSSLEVYARVSTLCHSIDEQIARETARTLSEFVFVDYALARLDWLGVKNLSQVDAHLKAHSESIVKFAAELLGPGEAKDRKVSRGMSLFYLAYVLVGQRSPQAVEQFVLEAMGSDLLSPPGEFAEVIRTTWERVAGAKPGAARSRRSSPIKARSSAKPKAPAQ